MDLPLGIYLLLNPQQPPPLPAHAFNQPPPLAQPLHQLQSSMQNMQPFRTSMQTMDMPLNGNMHFNIHQNNVPVNLQHILQPNMMLPHISQTPMHHQMHHVQPLQVPQMGIVSAPEMMTVEDVELLLKSNQANQSKESDMNEELE